MPLVIVERANCSKTKAKHGTGVHADFGDIKSAVFKFYLFAQIKLRFFFCFKLDDKKIIKKFGKNKCVLMDRKSNKAVLRTLKKRKPAGLLTTEIMAAHGVHNANSGTCAVLKENLLHIALSWPLVCGVRNGLHQCILKEKNNRSLKVWNKHRR